MIPAWVLAPVIGISVIAGFGLCLVLAALIRTTPMEGARYTGGLGEDPDDLDPDSLEQLLRDADGQAR